MNTLKFSNIRDMTTERHNLQVSDTKNLILQAGANGLTDNAELVVHNPCTLNLMITSRCNNSCIGCLNNKHSLHTMENDTWLSILENLLYDITEQGVNIEVSVSGGEPTLNPYRLIKTMEICHKYNCTCRSFLTNGIGIMQAYQGKAIIEHMLINDFKSNISINRGHFDEHRNAYYFGNGSGDDSIYRGVIISNYQLEQICRALKLNGATPMLSCVLTKTCIDTLDKMLEYLDWATGSIGVNMVMFRERIGAEGNGIMPIADMVGMGKEKNLFTDIDGLYGEQYTVEVMQYKEYLVKHYITNTSKTDSGGSTGDDSRKRSVHSITLSDIGKVLWN